MIERTLFSPEHETFRASFQKFMAREIVPFHAQWEEQGYVDRAVWNKAGEHGFLCPSMPEALGGAGADRLYSVVQMEELARAGTTGIVHALPLPPEVAETEKRFGYQSPWRERRQVGGD